MNDMIFSDYYSMIKNSGIDTKLIEYRFDEKLLACCITDFLEESLSMVYSFYSPKYLKFSLGKFMILDHICLSKDMYKELLYLGYWIHGFKDMNYKSDFNSTEILINNNWIKYEKENSYF
jgi:arginine-tRNA-protein transferase